MRYWIFFTFAVLIAYGSLYPFHFTVPEAETAAWVKLFSDWSPLTSKADALGNAALFVPFGCAGMLAIAVRAGLPFRIAATVVVNFMLALVLQVAQIYVPERTAALGDVIWNMAGTAVGIVIGALAADHQGAPRQRWQWGAVLPLGLIALWLAAELVPFVPSLDVQSIKTNLKGLLHPTVAAEQLLFHTAGAILAGWALAAIVGTASSLGWLLVLAGMVAAGKVFIVTSTLDVSTLSGLALGCAGWWLLANWPEPRRSTALVVLLFAAYVLGAIMPFEIRDIPEPFNLVPFAGMLQGSMLANSRALAANLCLYAGILGVTRINGGAPGPSSIALAILVALFEAAQTYLSGRTPDITDPLLVLLVGQMLRFAPVPVLKHVTGKRAPPVTPMISGGAVGALLPAARFNAIGWGLGLGIICMAMALAFALALRLPQIPYNVAELFLGGGAFPFLIIFALALLWVGAGARLAGYYVAMSARPWLALPLLAFGAGIVSLLLLCASVTQESIGDIAGSNNLHWFVANKDIWGEWARRLFLLVPSDVVSFFERPVRYAALYGPLITFLALMFAGIEMREHGRAGAGRVWPLMVSAVLWLWLCKAVAFDWSSTDNLNELIAADGPWGWGGGGYLYALLAVICANAVLVARMRLTFLWMAVAAGVTLGMVPVGWWLLNQGLEQQVHKYDLVFSGVQFLLGPDRKNLLSPEILFLRWSVVQLAGILVIAVGARIAQPVAGWRAWRRTRYITA